MHSVSLPETFSFRDEMCFYTVARIQKSLFVNEIKFGFIVVAAYGERSRNLAKWNLCCFAKDHQEPPIIK